MRGLLACFFLGGKTYVSRVKQQQRRRRRNIFFSGRKETMSRDVSKICVLCLVGFEVWPCLVCLFLCQEHQP